jgi:hypothetical protein
VQSWEAGLRRGPLRGGEKDNREGRCRPIPLAELRTKGGSEFDIADDGGENFIERAAVELKKLLDAEAIGIADGIDLRCEMACFLA